MTTIPYWRLSSFYFFYFALVGTLMPFFSLYLHALSFTPQQIGVVGAVLMATKIFSPNIWGWLSDRTGKRLVIIRWGAFASMLSFALVFWYQDFVGLLLVLTFFSFFWNAILAQFEVITLGYLKTQPHNYSRIRLWGSVGFIVVVLALGGTFDWLDISAWPWFMLAFLLLLWVSSLTIKEATGFRIAEGGEGFLQCLKRRPVICFVLSCILLQASHGAYYTFYSIYLEELGFSRSVIGALWALGVIAEVLVFLVMHRLMHRYSLRVLLLASLFLTVVRWWLIGCFSSSLVLLVVAQLLHAFSFGSAHAVGIELIRQYFPGAAQGQGQALYSAAGFGAGAALGALMSGLLWPLSPVLAFAAGAACAALAFVVIWWGLPKQQ